MDYSTGEVTSSPWATSPRQSKPNFGQSTSEDIPPTTPELQQQEPIPYRSTDEYSTSYSQTTSTSENGHSEQNASSHNRSQENRSDQQHPQSQDQQQPQQPSGGDKPQQQSKQTGVRTQQTRAPQPKHKLQAKVNGLERTGRKDPILRFDVYTNLPSFRTTQFRDVRRTHQEFGRLADHLVSAHPEAMVPAIPPSATPAGVGTDEDEVRVKANMQRWLSYVCDNDNLIHDEEMLRFVEGDPGYSPVVKLSQPATGVRRKMLKQFSPPKDENTELAEARPVVKRFYLGAMDASQKVDKVVKARRAGSLAETEFGNRLNAMSEIESHAGLKTAYRKLGRTIQTEADLRAAQGTAEATVLSDPLQYHSSDAFIVKETLTNRQILMRELVQAQQTTRSKLSATDRLKSSTSVRRDKVDEAIAALDEARQHEQFLGQKVAGVTANLVHERRKWFANTSADLRAAIREYVIREIEFERRALATLEAVRPDVRAIDPSGGLSRLGRDPNQVRRSNVASSQGPKGDAWSGVARRQDALNRSISSSYVSTPVPELGDSTAIEGLNGAGRPRGASLTGSLKSAQEDDEDRVDARNAASRLATSTF